MFRAEKLHLKVARHQRQAYRLTAEGLKAMSLGALVQELGGGGYGATVNVLDKI
jgi:hypothetical protein